MPSSLVSSPGAPPALNGRKAGSAVWPHGAALAKDMPDCRSLGSMNTGNGGSPCDSVSSTMGGARSGGGGGGGCEASLTASPSSSYQPAKWDADAAHSQSSNALVSPVMLNGKKKGGLLNGLKKMFSHKQDGRAATGAGSEAPSASNGSTSAFGTSAPLKFAGAASSSFLESPVPQSTSSRLPNGLKVQVGGSMSRDLAALLTSPARPLAAPGSPVVLNSPMPSMRLDSTSIFSSSPHGGDNADFSPQCGSDQRLHPLTPSSAGGVNPTPSSLRAHEPTSPFSVHITSATAIAASAASSRHPLHPHAPITTSHSSHLPSPSKLGSGHLSFHHQNTAGAGGGGTPMTLKSSLSSALATTNNLASGSFSSSSLTQIPMVRGDSAEDFASALGGAAAANNTGSSAHHGLVHNGSVHNGSVPNGSSFHSGRLALPQLAGAAPSPRSGPQESSLPSSPSPSGGGSRRAATPLLPGMDQAAAAVRAVELPAAAMMTEAEAEEEEDTYDDMPRSVLLGMNPGVPTAMRRRNWSLDDFTVAKRLYKGQTSAVYRATCNRTGLMVALKVYFLNRVPINVVHMIRREIDLHIPLVHRNIIMLYAAFRDDKHIVLVQEYAARGDLFGIHRSMNCRLTETQTTELVLMPFLEALQYLHARGVMHRDIKPENILFTQEWALKIADFGVSINVTEERAVTRTGTTDYMAPEVERCPLKHTPQDNKDNPNLAYTTAIDIWSIGVLAYEMLVGFPPFVADGGAPDADDLSFKGGKGVAAFMAAEATRSTLRFPASTSAAAKDFIMTTLAEAPGDRPTAQQLLKHPWVFKVARRQSTTVSSRFSGNIAVNTAI